jgi:hypothetical protein
MGDSWSWFGRCGRFGIGMGERGGLGAAESGVLNGNGIGVQGRSRGLGIGVWVMYRQLPFLSWQGGAYRVRRLFCEKGKRRWRARSPKRFAVFSGVDLSSACFWDGRGMLFFFL